uniref:Uncharacterized protein n=1 Tax=Anguilla anguilla TaxID=7936 RepID=A0A0E9PX86_ANGAN
MDCLYLWAGPTAGAHWKGTRCPGLCLAALDKIKLSTATLAFISPLSEPAKSQVRQRREMTRD